METPADAPPTICRHCGSPLAGSTGGRLCVACLLEPALAGPGENGLDASGRFAHYEVLTHADGSPVELGHGTMGVTYRALDMTLRCVVALKVINADLAAHGRARERFLREARAAARLRHPNVARVLFFGEQPGSGHCFYAMELVEGETLEARVRRAGAVPVPVALEIAAQVADALGAAEEHGLTHRDLKPANLMLAAGETVHVKIIDFGLARAAAVGTTAEDARLTGGGEFVGTPAFASPEQFAADAVVDARSDFFALGATLWYALTGRVPFAGRTLSEIYEGQTCHPLPTDQLAAARLPSAVVALLRSLLSADPAGRPQDARELADSLRRCRAAVEAAPLARRRQHRRWLLAGALALGLLVVGWVGPRVFRFRPVAAGPEVIPEKSVAVLPLENLGGDRDDLFFADGIQDDLLTSLGAIQELKVISRSSVAGYRLPAARDLREISAALGVSNVLEGSVRRAGNRVVVNVRLTEAQTGRQLWAQRYDRTLSDALTIQGELATEIAAALRATLSPEERARVAIKPTDNADAYVLYLRARDFQVRDGPRIEDCLEAERLYGEALALDPGFALAHARLAATLGRTYHWFQPTVERKARMRAEAEEALRLRPGLGEGHYGLALYHYWTEGDYGRAQEELALATRTLPHDGDVALARALIERRQGHWREALVGMEAALRNDPRNTVLLEEWAHTLYLVRDWPAAAAARERALAVTPGSRETKLSLAYIDFSWHGDLAPLRSVAASFAPDEATILPWDVALLARDFAAAERAVDACPVEAVPVTFSPPLPKSYLRGSIALARGEPERARPYFEAALPAFEAEVRRSPRDAYRHANLGLLLAYLGRKEDALREGRYAVELKPESDDAVDGPSMTAFLAQILVRNGQHAEAITLIERLLTAPGAVFYDSHTITQNDLRQRWEWDPLRGDPRFQKILDGPEPRTLYP